MKKLFISKSSRRSAYKRMKNYERQKPKNNFRAGQEIVTSADPHLASVSVVERKFDTDRDKSSRF